MHNATFEGQNGSGTALILHDSTVQITESKFISNKNGAYNIGLLAHVGGALVSINSILTIEHSVFSDNEAARPAEHCS